MRRERWDDGASIHRSQIGIGSRFITWKSGAGSMRSDGEDRAEAAARPEVVHRLIDLGERPPRRDEAFEVQATRLPERDQPRDVADGIAAPERAAHELL